MRWRDGQCMVVEASMRNGAGAGGGIRSGANNRMSRVPGSSSTDQCHAHDTGKLLSSAVERARSGCHSRIHKDFAIQAGACLVRWFHRVRSNCTVGLA